MKKYYDPPHPRKLLPLPKGGLRVLVVDDDPLFLRRVRGYALKHDIKVRTCRKTSEVPSLIENEFDVALVDYYLDDREGTDVASVLEGVPVVLMSSIPLGFIEDPSRWPRSVKKFVCKENGTVALFNCAIRLLTPPSPKQRNKSMHSESRL